MSATNTMILTQLRNRHAAAARLPRFTCGCADPWTCPHKADSQPMRTDATIAAMRHLADAGIPGLFPMGELRSAWGTSDADDELLQQARYQTGARPVTRLQPRHQPTNTRKAAA